MGSALGAAAADGGFLSAANDAGDGRVATASNTKINPSLRMFLEISEGFILTSNISIDRRSSADIPRMNSSVVVNLGQYRVSSKIE
jgi:hypothetical protein